MAIKGFKVESFSDFTSLADQATNSPKFVDTRRNIAFFYLKKRIEYEVEDSKEIDQLKKKGFVAGEETETIELW